MVTFRSFNDVVLNIISKLRLSQPNLDTKPGSVTRDIVDSVASQVAEVYDELKNVADLQSIFNVTGDDLTNIGTNFGLSRRTGSKSTGTGLLTFRTLDTDVTIAVASVGRTRGADSFLTTATTSIKTTDSNSLRSTANRFATELQLAGISDQFAIEVTFQSQNIGSFGNISSYQLISHNIPNVNGITNISSFTGGSDLESDSAFRSRVLSSFIGGNTGTALAYRSMILNISEIVDALVIEPGDPLMTRDGTDVGVDSDGNAIVTEPGSGGRVDIYVMGENPQPGTDSYIYRDQSGLNDPTNSENNFIMGQSSLTPSTSLTINTRRVNALSADGNVPNQPIASLSSVRGSSSGTNFIEEYVNSAGVTKGNYKLTKDTGSAGGSPFGLDKFSWISNAIELEDESRTKSLFNSVDPLAFTDVEKIPSIQQDIIITDENSSISSNNAYVVLEHTPVRTTTRIFNVTTGERYTVSDQNPDGSTGALNTSGRVKISGNTLPKSSDILQVDYIWVHSYDSYVDFDGIDPTKDRLNTSVDSVEWGFSNYIREELGTVAVETNGSRYVLTQFNMSRVLSVNTFVSEIAVVDSNKKLTVSNSVSNIWEVRDSTIAGIPEVYNTPSADGVFSNTQITLPSDTIAQTNDSTTITYNLVDYMNIDGYDSSGRINNNKITLPTKTLAAGTPVLINYVANFDTIIPQRNITQLPSIGDGQNGFNSIADGYQPFQNNFTGTTITKNVRRSPTRLDITASNIGGNGILSVAGTTINKVEGVFTVTSKDTIDFASLIREEESLINTAAIPSSISISRVVQLDKVTVNSAGDITATLASYNLKNYALLSNNWDKAEAAIDSTLSRSQMRLSSFQSSTSFAVGTKMYVKFYYSKINDVEELFFSKDGVKITDKVFGYISGIDRVSGFSSSGVVTGNIVVKTFNQPDQNDIYLTDYNYTAPKTGERITIVYNYNKVLVDGTNEIEEIRPITSDVLVKAATKIELEVTAYIIVSSSYSTLSETVKQNVANNIASTLNATSLGTTLDSSDIVDGAYNVDGLDRIRIIKFNKANVTGSKLSIVAESNEYLAAGTVTVTTETR